MNYDRYAKKVYEWNVSVGWWDDPDRCISQTCMLIVTEIAEATEGERRDLMDDHLPDRKQGEVELADALIRVLDLGGKFNLSYESDYLSHPYCESRFSIGKQHMGIVYDAVGLDGAIQREDSHSMRMCYSSLINSIADVSKYRGYNLEAATIDKMLYNTTRLDHKREQRAHFDGKKF